MLKNLKKLVYVANKRLAKLDLTDGLWGHVSGIERERGLLAVKPGDVTCKDLTPDDMIVIDLEGRVIEGEGTPAKDIITHLYVYSKFQSIGSVASLHSPWATIFAQAGLPIPAYGITHLEYFKGGIPCTRSLLDEEITAGYETGIGKVIAEAFSQYDPAKIPGVLVKNHAPFTWGESPIQAVFHATALEKVAKMAYRTSVISTALGAQATPVPKAMLEIISSESEGGIN